MEDKIKLAKKYLEEGLYSRAIEELKFVIEKQPESIEAHEQLALAYLQTAEIQEAANQYLTIAELYQKEQKIDRAIQALKEILSLNSSHLIAREKLAEIYQASGNIKQAITEYMILANKYLHVNHNKVNEIYQKILELEPENIEVRKRLIELNKDTSSSLELADQYLTIGELYKKRGILSKALPFYEKAADLFASCEEFEKASELYKFLIEAEPTNSTLRKKLIKCNQRTSPQKIESPLPTLIESPEKDVKSGESIESPILTQEIEEQISKGEFELAKKLLSTALERNANDVETLTRLSFICVQLGDVHEAIDYYFRLAEQYESLGAEVEAINIYNRIIELDKTNIKAYENLAKLYLSSSDKENAVYLYQTLAKIYEDKNLLDNAIFCLKQALEINPEDVELQKKLAKLYLKTNNKKMAIVVFSELAELCYRQNLVREGIDTYREILVIDPENIVARVKLADLYFKAQLLEEAEAEYNSALEYYQKNNKWNETIPILKKLIDISPTRAKKYWKLLAEIYLKLNKTEEAISSLFTLATLEPFEEAVSIYLRILELDPKYAQAREKLIELFLSTGKLQLALTHLLVLANTYLTQNELDKALIVFTKALEIDKKNKLILEKLSQLCASLGKKEEAVGYYLQLAELYREDSLNEEAEECYLKALELDPSNKEAYNSLISLYLAQGKIEKGIELLKIRGQNLSNLGAYDEAEKIFLQAVELDSNDINSRENLLDIYLKLGKKEQAFSQCLLLADLSIKANQIDKAIAFLNSALFLQPKNPSLHEKLAQLYLTQGQNDLALKEFTELIQIYNKDYAYDQLIETYKKYLEISPKNVEVRYELIKVLEKTKRNNEALLEYKNLAALYFEIGTISKAIKVLKRANSIPAEGFIKYELECMLAEAYLKEGNLKYACSIYQSVVKKLIEQKLFSEAAEILSQYLRVNPDDADNQYQLGQVYLGTGNFYEAMLHFQQAAEKYQKVGKIKQAIEAFQRAIDLDPTNLEIQSALIELYKKAGEETKAKTLAFQVYSKMAEKANKEGKIDEAITAYKQAIQADPENLELRYKLISLYQHQNSIEPLLEQYYQLGNLAERKKDYQKAIEAYKLILTYDPENIEVRTKLCEVYIADGQITEAIANYKILAQRFQQANQLDSAIAIYKTILNVTDTDTEARDNLIKLYFQTSRTLEAIKEAMILANQYIKMNKLGDAINCYNFILELDPENITAINELAKTYLACGEREKALSQFMVLSSILEKKSFL